MSKIIGVTVCTNMNPEKIKGSGGGNSVYFSEEEPTDAKTGDFWFDESEGESEGGGASVQPDWNQNDSSAPDYVKNRPFYKGKEVALVLDEADFSLFGDEYGEKIIYANIDRLQWFVDEDSIDLEITVEDVENGKTIVYTAENASFYADPYFANLSTEFFGFGITNGQYFDGNTEEWYITDDTKSLVEFRPYGEYSLKKAVLYKVDLQRIPDWAMPKAFDQKLVSAMILGLDGSRSTEGEFVETDLSFVENIIEVAKWAQANNALIYDFEANIAFQFSVEPTDLDVNNPELASFYYEKTTIDPNDGRVVHRVQSCEFYIDSNGVAWERSTHESRQIGTIS